MKFLDYKSTEAEIGWLKEVVKSKGKATPVQIKVKLLGILPDGFGQSTIDPRLINNWFGVTLHGLYLVEPTSRFFGIADKLIKAIRDEIKLTPSMTMVGANLLADKIGENLEDVEVVLKLISELGHFNSGSVTHKGRVGLSELHFSDSGTEVIDEYFQYKDIAALLERSWARRGRWLSGKNELSDLLETGLVSTPVAKEAQTNATVSTETLVEMPRIPEVFVSYSHDTKEHKIWVTEFATKLRANGINVVLDIWDLKHGEDVASFMRNAVTDAERVLMVCTENYVRKSNDGIGGAGYEAMIITGELVREQGKAKFIPVIKQAIDPPTLLNFLPTKKYANLSSPENEEEEFQKLLRSLHDLAPEKKPPLGKNPFSPIPADVIPAPVSPLTKLDGLSSPGENPDATAINQLSLQLALVGDIGGWRKLINKVKAVAFGAALSWMKALPKDRWTSESLTVGVRTFDHLFAAVLGGLESEKDKFRRQSGLLSELANPVGWPLSGLTAVVEFPKTIVSLYFYTYGALSMATEQFDNAYDVAYSFFDDPRYPLRSHLPIFMRTDIGPNTYSVRDVTNSWTFLCKLPETMPSLAAVFGSNEEWLSGLFSFFIFLCALELSDAIENNQGVDLSPEEIAPQTALYFLRMEPNVLRKSVAILTENRHILLATLTKRNIDPEKIRKNWPIWCERMYSLTKRYDEYRDEVVRVGIERIFVV